MDLDVKKLFYGQKKCFGLNMHGICDHKQKFLDIDIAHPASISDYLSFGTSPIFTLLKTLGFLCDGLTIYSDNVYVNIPYTTSPFETIPSGPTDAHNFYHSQIRINIKCAFRMLINKWAVL